MCEVGLSPKRLAVSTGVKAFVDKRHPGVVSGHRWLPNTILEPADYAKSTEPGVFEVQSSFFDILLNT